MVAAAFRVGGERRMLRIRDIADTARRTVLRPLPVGFGGLDHAAVYLSADSEARVGGDFYDIQPGPHGARVLVGDVQGKGLGAVETAAALLGTFREAAYRGAEEPHDGRRAPGDPHGAPPLAHRRPRPVRRRPVRHRCAG
ncbi:hypothetical protein STENM36S_02563 [Streptomyces tendae]